MPFFDFLVNKMEGWRGHRPLRCSDFRAKLGADVTDIRPSSPGAVGQDRGWKEYRRHIRVFMRIHGSCT